MKIFEVIVMIGIPGSGKTTFCKSRFFPEKVHVSLDQLRSRKVEDELFSFCLRHRISCVIDNTNVNTAERRRYIVSAHKSIDSASGAGFLAVRRLPVAGRCL